MRFRTLTLTFMSALAIGTLAGAVHLWSSHLADLRRLDEGQALAALMEPAVRFVETLSLERGVYNQVLVSKAATFEESGRLIAERKAATDPLFATALDRARQLPEALHGEIGDSLARARDIVAEARREAEPFLAERAETSKDAAARLVTRYFEAGAQVDVALADAERRLARLDPSFATLTEISRLTNDIREQAGYRSVLLSRFAASGKAFTIPERVEVAEASGAVRVSWRRLQRLAAEAGGPPTIAAVARVKTEFFDKATPTYTAMIDAARVGAPPPMEFLAWRKWTVAQLSQLLATRDPPIAQIGERLAQMRGEALRSAYRSFAGICVLLALMIAAGISVERRVLRPIGSLTRALDGFTSRNGLQSADKKLAVRFATQDDEIGSLARATLRMRDHTHQLEALNARFNALIDNLPQGVSFYDPNDALAVANRRYCEPFGLPDANALIGLSYHAVAQLGERLGTTPAPGVDARLRAALADGGAEPIANCIVELPHGRIVVSNGLRTPDGGWLSTHLDITERRRAEQQIAYMADHDTLTGLANRALFARELERALALAAAHPDRGFAVMCLDLDRFKLVNDRLGHACGDELLRQVGDRPRHNLRTSDRVARLGGDEFVVLVDCAEASLAELAERLVAVLSEPYDLESHKRADVSVSIGVAVAPTDGTTPGDLLRAADLAMYRAKTDGRRGYRFFEPEMDLKIQVRRALERDMRAAIEEEQFELHYQPIVSAQSHEIVSFEALLRWNHPTRGRISPADFIPLAEDSGLIVEIGAWALRRACTEARSWPRDVKVSVNLSLRQFATGRLLADIVAALAETGLSPGRLELEITERVMLENTEAILATLAQLRKLGVSIAMDDFGAGFSSLSYLRRFPFDKIKIDHTFVRDLDRDPESIAIVRAVAELARSLRMKTTAEGVETEAQFELLRAEGCTEIQGYFISRPAPASEIPRMLAESEGRREAA